MEKWEKEVVDLKNYTTLYVVDNFFHLKLSILRKKYVEVLTLTLDDEPTKPKVIDLKVFSHLKPQGWIIRATPAGPLLKPQ
jgi:hypothetical protein